MFRKIFSICVGAALVLCLLLAFWPGLAQNITNRVFNGIVAIEKGRVTIIGNQQVIKIVDPATVATVIKEGTPQIKAFFQKAEPESGELVIADIIDATNQERIKAGLQPLKVNAKLTESAKIKTNDMIVHQYFEHTSPDGVTVSDLGTEVGYDYVIIGENLAMGNFSDANDLVQAWMNSPGHRANILNTQYREIGIYAAKGVYEGHEVWFAVQHFGTGRNACPEIDKLLKQRIDAVNIDLNTMENQIETLKRELEAMKQNDPSYDAKVDRFNNLVNTYNSELSESKIWITQYNEQVSAFNSCLSKYQK